MKLFKAVIRKDGDNKKERDVYVVADSMPKAATLLGEKLAIEEELREIYCVSEEVYVGK